MSTNYILLLMTIYLLRYSKALDSSFDHHNLNPKPIIIDTDIFSDVDDVGALAVANALHNCGKADLRAVMINTNSEYGSLAASVSPPARKQASVRITNKNPRVGKTVKISDYETNPLTTHSPKTQAINTYFSNPSIPIAALRPLTRETFHDTRHYRLGEYASKLAHVENFPRSLANASSAPEPVDLYRSSLASAANASVTIISLGFLTNLAALLSSPPDAHSSQTGLELVSSKVRELVVMGGRYPSGWEFNFGWQVNSTREVFSRWPRSVPVTFSGYELGSKVFSGGRLGELAEGESPVLAAYQWYGDRCNTTRASYDPVTVLYGVMGLGGLGGREFFEYANENGYNVVGEDGSNAWVEDGEVRNQHWLRLRDGVRGEEVGEMLDMLFARGAASSQCCFPGACEGSMKMNVQ